MECVNCVDRREEVAETSTKKATPVRFMLCVLKLLLYKCDRRFGEKNKLRLRLYLLRLQSFSDFETSRKK